MAKLAFPENDTEARHWTSNGAAEDFTLAG